MKTRKNAKILPLAQPDSIVLRQSTRTERKTVFARNLALLTLTALAMRGIGVAFGAYLSDTIGAAGMGLYALIMSVYAFAVTFAASGINLAVTRCVAEALGRGSPNEAKRVLRAGIFYALFFGLLSSALLFFGADYAGTIWLGDVRTVSSLKLLAVTLCPISLGTVMNGYFTAVRRVGKNAVCAVAEQAVKIGLTVFLLTRLQGMGLEYACLAMVGGSCIAEGASLLLSGVLCGHDIRRHLSFAGERGIGHAAKRVTSVALPVAVTAWARTGLVTLEHILIPQGLKKSGATAAAALAAYGTIHGMVFPVIFFPTALSGAFAGLLVPELADFHARGDTQAIRRTVTRALSLTLLYAFGCMAVFACLARPIGMALYHEPEACRYIFIFSFLIPLSFLDTTVDCILKGLGAQVSVMVINLIDAGGCVLAVWLFVPHYGVMGYVWIVFVSEAVNLACSLGKLASLCPVRFPVAASCFAPLLSAVGASAASALLHRFLPLSFTFEPLSLAVRIALTALLYLLFCASLLPNRIHAISLRR